MKIPIYGVTLIVGGVDLSGYVADGSIVVGPLVVSGPEPVRRAACAPSFGKILRFPRVQRGAA